MHERGNHARNNESKIRHVHTNLAICLGDWSRDWFARALAFISGRAAADAMRHRGWKAAGRKRLASSASRLMPSLGE